MKKSVKKIVSVVAMLVITAGVVAAGYVVKSAGPKVYMGDPVDISGMNTEAYQVTALEQDEEGNYIVYAFGTGYNEGTPIELAVAFDPTAATILAVRIVSQSETNGLGSKIGEEDFLAQFVEMSAPVTTGGLNPINPATEEAASGATSFDGVTAATMSSKGVAKIVNNSYFFLNDCVVQ